MKGMVFGNVQEEAALIAAGWQKLVISYSGVGPSLLAIAALEMAGYKLGMKIVVV
jgi:ribosomal protein L16/L10AE